MPKVDRDGSSFRRKKRVSWQMMNGWWNGLSFLVGNLILEPAHLPVAVSQGVHQGALLSLQHIALVNAHQRYALSIIPLNVKQIPTNFESKVSRKCSPRGIYPGCSFSYPCNTNRSLTPIRDTVRIKHYSLSVEKMQNSRQRSARVSTQDALLSLQHISLVNGHKRYALSVIR